MGNSGSQAKALVITPKCTACISIPCSLYIISAALSDNRKGKGTVMQRALVGMCFVDIVASSAWFLSTWAVPEGAVDLPYTRGNQATCAYQGFLLQLAIGAPLYNGTVAFYSLLMVRFNWREHHLRKIEPYVHFFILFFAIGTSFLGLFLEMYNPIGAVCWVIGDPADCGNSSYQPSDVPCNKGNWAWVFGIALFYGPLWLVVILDIVFMAVVLVYVKKTLKRLTRYAGSQSRMSFNRNMQYEPHREDHVRMVAIQALLYSISFLITWMPSTIWSVAHWFNVKSFWLDFAAAICEPLQGFWNYLIFIHKREENQFQHILWLLGIKWLLNLEFETETQTRASTTRPRKASTAQWALSLKFASAGVPSKSLVSESIIPHSGSQPNSSFEGEASTVSSQPELHEHSTVSGQPDFNDYSTVSSQPEPFVVS